MEGRGRGRRERRGEGVWEGDTGWRIIVIRFV